jgi:ubiquitin-conjugating enzyme E2 variant
MFDGRLFELRISCGPKYPVEAPKVRFVSKINLASVNPQNGQLQPDFPVLAQWNRNMSIETILVGLKNSMVTPMNRRLPQPPEGSYF